MLLPFNEDPSNYFNELFEGSPIEIPNFGQEQHINVIKPLETNDDGKPVSSRTRSYSNKIEKERESMK